MEFEAPCVEADLGYPAVLEVDSTGDLGPLDGTSAPHFIGAPERPIP